MVSDGKTGFSFIGTESYFPIYAMPSPDLSAVMLVSLVKFCPAAGNNWDVGDILCSCIRDFSPVRWNGPGRSAQTNGVAELSKACFGCAP